MCTHRLVIAVTTILLLVGCASGGSSREHMGQFFAGENSTGAVGPLSQGIARALPDPGQPIVIVYNHGTDWDGLFQDCVPGTMPGFLSRWTEKGMGGHEVVVFYLCTEKAENRFVMGKARSQENAAVLDQLLAAGVPREHIFIFGHSGGASATLLTAERAPEKFNAAVVSAPGYGFAYLDAQGENYFWMPREYDKWRSRLAGARDMSALVFLYEGDIYAPPGEALFLAGLPEVEVILVRDETGAGRLCIDEPEPHFYWWSACFRRGELQAVEAFVLDRLEHRLWLP